MNSQSWSPHTHKYMNSHALTQICTHINLHVHTRDIDTNQLLHIMHTCEHTWAEIETCTHIYTHKHALMCTHTLLSLPDYTFPALTPTAMFNAVR